jgi:type IV secretion system protein VirB10
VAGIEGKVDRHFAARFGSAIMLSLPGGAVEHIAAFGDSWQKSSQTITTTSPLSGEVTTITLDPGTTEAEARKIAAERTSSTLNEIASESFKETTKIPPTIRVNQGTPIVVFLKRDLDFSALYVDPVRKELAQSKRGGTPRKAFNPTPLYGTYVSAEQVKEVLPTFNSFHPLGRISQPHDVVVAMLFLASAEASWITGTVLSVDGGVMASR